MSHNDDKAKWRDFHNNLLNTMVTVFSIAPCSVCSALLMTDYAQKGFWHFKKIHSMVNVVHDY